MLSIKPGLHTQLPEHNKNYRKVSPGAFEHLEWTYDGAFEQLFGLERGEFEQKFSKNSNARGVVRGVLSKLRFDWYIILASHHCDLCDFALQAHMISADFLQTCYQDMLAR